jgi:hypothetical protein
MSLNLIDSGITIYIYLIIIDSDSDICFEPSFLAPSQHDKFIFDRQLV